MRLKNYLLMKSAIVAIAVSLSAIPSFGQWSQSGSNVYYNNGNVGIGTSNPSGRLVVLGGESQFGHPSYSDPHIGVAYDSKFGGPGRGIAVRGSSYFMGSVGIGTPNPSGMLHVYNGGIICERDGGNQLSMRTASQAWDFDVDIAQSNILRIRNMTAGTVPLVVTTSGNVGIGTTTPSTRLAVNGTIRAKEVIVTTQGWPDHVFKSNYNLKPLHEVEKFIKKNSHLEGIPTEKNVMAKGISIGEMQAKFLQKLEETTLYLIEMKNENDSIKKQNAHLQERLSALEKKLDYSTITKRQVSKTEIINHH